MKTPEEQAKELFEKLDKEAFEMILNSTPEEIKIIRKKYKEFEKRISKYGLYAEIAYREFPDKELNVSVDEFVKVWKESFDAPIELPKVNKNEQR